MIRQLETRTMEGSLPRVIAWRLESIRSLIADHPGAGIPSSEDLPERPAKIVTALIDLMELHDHNLPRHGERTARYAVALGRSIGWTQHQIVELRHAALLHDIGKLFLPTTILEKDGPLTHTEYVAIQSHPRAGADLVHRFPGLSTAAVWIAHHHERWDGFGYPYGFRGTLIPLGARILAVADTFDRLTSKDMSRGPGVRGTNGCSIELLRVVSGSQLDPGLVETFVGLLLTDLEDSADESG